MESSRISRRSHGSTPNMFNMNPVPYPSPTFAAASTPSNAFASRRNQVGQGPLGTMRTQGGMRKGSSARNLIPLLELANDPSLVRELPNYSPLRYLLASGFIFLVYGAALVFSAIALPFPTYKGDNVDWFISIGWLLFAGAMIIFLTTSLFLLIKKHPFYPHSLLGYFISLCLFIGASTLHTARLNTSVSDLFSNAGKSSSITSVQLIWIGNFLYYAYFCVIIYRAAIVTLKVPPSEEREKYQMLQNIRMMSQQKGQLLHAIQLQQDAYNRAHQVQEIKAKHEEDGLAIYNAHRAEQQQQQQQLQQQFHQQPMEMAPLEPQLQTPRVDQQLLTPRTPPMTSPQTGLIRPAARVLHPSGDAGTGLPSSQQLLESEDTTDGERPMITPRHDIGSTIASPTSIPIETATTHIESPQRVAHEDPTAFVSPHHGSVMRSVEDDDE